MKKRRWVKVTVRVLVEFEGDGYPEMDVARGDGSAVITAKRGQVVDHCVTRTTTLHSNWTAETDALLGTAYDSVIAAELGVCEMAVGTRRRLLGIPPYDGPKPVERCSRLREFHAVLDELAASGPITTPMLMARGFTRQRLSKLVKRLPPGFEIVESGKGKSRPRVIARVSPT